MGLPDESDISFLKHAEGEDDLSGEDIVFDWPTSKQEPRLNWRWLALCMVLLVSTNTITLFLVKFSRDSHLDQICALHTSQNWTPILQDAQITYTPTRFNGSLFHETIYRKEASPDVDLAWRALGVDYYAMVVSVDEAEISGIELDRLKVEEEYGGPGYPVVVEALHQLHCLNLLRQSLYFNSDYYHKLGEGAFKNSEKMLKRHIGHCLDMVRQSLICNADTGLQPFVWVGDPPHPFPDFSREHKCKNFDAIRESARRRQEKSLENMNVLPLNGALILKDVP